MAVGTFGHLLSSGLLFCVFNLKCSVVYFQRCHTFTLPDDSGKSSLGVYQGVYLITVIGNASVNMSCAINGKENSLYRSASVPGGWCSPADSAKCQIFCFTEYLAAS